MAQNIHPKLSINTHYSSQNNKFVNIPSNIIREKRENSILFSLHYIRVDPYLCKVFGFGKFEMQRDHG